MERRDFLKKLVKAGMATPFLTSLLMSCDDEQILKDFDVNFTGKVLVIGAGSAGLIAGHILNQQQIDFEILEASSVFGGRVKKAPNFADFPIDLGAEWIHTNPSIFAELLNDPSSQASIDLVVYQPQTIYTWHKEELKKKNFFSNFYKEYKFKSTTWYDFFDQFIVPSISDKIRYNNPVTAIDYSGDKVIVETLDDTFEADKVLVTVPLTILQNKLINFKPALPTAKTDAIDQVSMPDGLKVFIEFKERFYPDIVMFGGLSEAMNDEKGDKVFYDAAFRKDSSKNVLGLFTVGEPAAEYTSLSNEQIINNILAELDKMFDGKASANYLQHVIQNWSQEPYIRGSYTHYTSNQEKNLMGILSQPIDDKVYFAGEAYSSLSFATVHGAGQSSYEALRNLLKT